jgi:NAD+ synthase
MEVESETDRITKFLSLSVNQKLRRFGAVVGISGGIDSSVVLALCVRAFGAEHVLGILLPERESSPESAELAHLLADRFNVQTVTEEISGALEGVGCYRRRDEALSRVFPEYGPGWKVKITLPGSLLEKNTLNVFSATVISPQGESFTRRLPAAELNQIVAASNFKQRTRMAMLYYHAERLNYAVAGTAQKNEHDLGFFVKYGDGGVDVAPILHLYKSQVYQLARYLEVPEEIQSRPPTTDTYSAGSTQEEFFFRVPYPILDLVWLGFEQDVAKQAIADILELTEEQVGWIEMDILRKQRTTAYLRTSPLAISDFT